MPMSRPIERGQVFISVDPRGEGRQIIVLKAHPRAGSTWIGTYNPETGRVSRQRWMLDTQFHDSPRTQNETARVTGYVLKSAL